MKRSREIESVMRRIYESVNDGDGGTLTKLLSTGEGLVFIGTDPDEWFDDRESIVTMVEAQAAAGIHVRSGDVRAYEEGSVGWVADSGVFVLPDGSEVPYRITVVFHREDGEWKIVQEHASIGVGNEDAIGTDL